MNERELLEQASTLASRIMDQIIEAKAERQASLPVVLDALSAVLVALFLHQDFGEISRERGMTLFLQGSLRHLIEAIERGEDVSNRMN